MVGVAGKSKGCNTCRRRKVRCDGGKPTCERCKQTKRECEGYERYPVFITKTQAGYVKRAPLEEVKLPSAQTNPTTCALDSSPSALVFGVSSPDAEATQLVCWFWKSFARSPPSKYALQNPSHWLDYFMNWNSTILPLRQALLAVAVTRLSRTSDRPDILKTSRRMYTNSLTMTRKALLDPKLTLHDEVLATICVMTLYEMFDSSTDNLDGWLNHLSGIYRLLEHRGPKLHISNAAHALFEHARYLIMLQYLVLRKSCVLAEPDWLHCPWQDMEKSVEQQVFDYGFRLTSVYERCDLVMQGCSHEIDVVVLLSDCMNIFDGIGRLQDQFIWPAATTDMKDASSPTADPALFKNPAGVMLSITALGIKLGACATACDIYGHVTSDAAALASAPDHLRSRAVLLHIDRHIVAKHIIAIVQECVKERVGAMGAARMMFSLQIAIKQFSTKDPEYEECSALMERLSGLSRMFRGVMTERATNNSLSTAGPDLVKGNASILAAQWQHLAHVCNGTQGALFSMPPQVGNLPCEALRSWAGPT